MTDNAKREIANRLRELAKENTERFGNSLRSIADELDPPKPEPGTVVWWRFLGGDKWRIGEVSPSGSGIRGLYWNSSPIYWDSIEYNPARILGPNEVAVKVPPVSEWPRSATGVGVYYENGRGLIDPIQHITRDKIKAREAENGD